MRTKEQIEEQISELKKRMKQTSQLSMFSKNNYFKYEAAKNALENNWDETDLRIQSFMDKESKELATQMVKWLKGENDYSWKNDMLELKSYLQSIGKLEIFEESGGEFTVKITDGYINNAIKTMNIYDRILNIVSCKYGYISIFKTDKNLFHLVLNQTKTETI